MTNERNLKADCNRFLRERLLPHLYCFSYEEDKAKMMTTGCINKYNPLEKFLYFNNGNMDWSQTFRLYMSRPIYATFSANFILITYMVQRIQQLKI